MSVVVILPGGVCARGYAQSPVGLIDRNGTVYGINALDGVDASLMPTSIRGPNNITTLMIRRKSPFAWTLVNAAYTKITVAIVNRPQTTPRQAVPARCC